MFGFIIFLLVLWLVLAIIGFTIKGLFWLAIIAVVLFLATAMGAWLRRRAGVAGKTTRR
ncbi:hypothetical protein SAMN05216282_13610 [Cryobacterium psychrotolerans]|uniref:LPXTG cell wall anchor domain-containing protein n=1 Tax=Cryobacterium psychrotolerans TaxID=386301 RepID=A0A1G9HRL7_9MICO|nr:MULTISPECIES: hypothetical protein [Cryobacterium]SDL15598.1 hypothetical protein SAMN05216282_13610 [Cryobacterium psychrotolerans]